MKNEYFESNIEYGNRDIMSNKHLSFAFSVCLIVKQTENIFHQRNKENGNGWLFIAITSDKQTNKQIEKLINQPKMK